MVEPPRNLRKSKVALREDASRLLTAEESLRKLVAGLNQSHYVESLENVDLFSSKDRATKQSASHERSRHLPSDKHQNTELTVRDSFDPLRAFEMIHKSGVIKANHVSNDSRGFDRSSKTAWTEPGSVAASEADEKSYGDTSIKLSERQRLSQYPLSSEDRVPKTYR